MSGALVWRARVRAALRASWPPPRGPRAAARAEPGAELDAVADVVHRVAILLAAGLDPLSALRALPTDDARDPLAAAAGCADPLEVPAALLRAAAGEATGVRAAWSLLAASWTVAVEAGAPLAVSLDRAADSLRALADADRQVELALTGPLATARIVAMLPLAGVGMALLIGADPLGVILGTVPGAIAAALGALAIIAGLRWNRRLVAVARRTDPLAGVGQELLALAMAGGAAPELALSRVRTALERCGVDADLDGARASLAFAARVGVPVGALLRAEAGRARRIALADVLRRAALLGTRLLGPLALCFLPGFVLLGVVPLVIGILRGTLAAF